MWENTSLHTLAVILFCLCANQLGLSDCPLVASSTSICSSVNVSINDAFNCWGGCWENDVSFPCDSPTGLILGDTMDSGNYAIFDFSGTCQWEGTAVSLAMEHCSSPYPSSFSLPCTWLVSWQEGCNITSSVVCEVMLAEVKLAWATDELLFTEVGTREFGAVNPEVAYE